MPFFAFLGWDENMIFQSKCLIISVSLGYYHKK